MERKNPRKNPIAGGGPPAKVSRKRNKNGMSKIKEEKHPVGGPDPGGGSNGPGSTGQGGPPGGHYDPQSMDGSNIPPKGLPDELLMNGGDIKLENPSTPHQPFDGKNECPPDIPPLSELGHDFPPDCKPPMNYNCYPHYNNMPPNNMNMPPHPSGDFGPPHPHGPHGGGPCGPHGGMNYSPQQPPPQMSQQQPHPPTKQQPSTLEAQYMQQQSQIFVFSTKLANKAAEAVFQQQFPSIIAFHMAQPTTRKFLEKNPFKLNNFGRQFQGNPNWPAPTPPPPSGKMGKGSKGQGQMSHQMQPGPPPPHPNMPPDFNPMHQGQGPPGAPWNTQHPSKQQQQQGYSNYFDGQPYPPCQQQGGPGGPGGPMGGPGGPMGGPGGPMGGPGGPMGGPGGPMGGPGGPMGGPGGPMGGPGGPMGGPGGPMGGPGGPMGGPGGHMGGPGGHMGGPGGPMGGPGGHMGGPGGQMGGPGGPMGGPGSGQPPPGYFGGPQNHGPQGPMPPGVKVPDENLTPQQRMHREEQLAKMKRMQALLFPENNDPNQSHNVPGDSTNCHPMPPHENLDVYNMPGEPPPGGPMGHMDYMSGPGPGPGGKPPGNDWSSPPSGFFMDGQSPSQGMKPHGPGSMPPSGMGNGRPNKIGGGSIPSPATPLTPSSSCGGPTRPSPHSPMSGGDSMYPGSGNHSYYPSSGYYSPHQVGQAQENSPSATVQRKDSESSNSDGGKSRKEKSSCSISPNSSAPPSVKEANLMPVPSPQQIQYLNVFEGQELTIQKQPNVGLTDPNHENSPPMPPNSMDMNPSTPAGQQKPSHSAPPTPVPLSSMGNQKSNSDLQMTSSSNSKTRPGSVGPVVTPKNSTTPNPSPRGLDSTSQPGTPLQMNLDGMKNSSGGPMSNNPNNMNNFGQGMGPNQSGGPPPSSCNMMKQGLPPIAMDGHPDGPGGPVFDNVPLNPNLSGPGPPGSKPPFDPISSMVQMSQQLTGGNGTPPNPSANNMGGNSGGYGMNAPGSNQMNPNNMVNFNTSMHSVQNVDGGLAMGGPQTVNNTYVNATMTIQQMNIQNIPPYMNHGPNMGPMSHQMSSHMSQQMGPMGQQMTHMSQIGSGPMGPMGGPNNMGQPPGNQMGGPGNPMGGPGNQMGGPGNQMGGPMGPMGQQMSGMGPMGCGSGPMGGQMPPRMGFGNQGPPRLGQGPGPGQGGPPRGGPYRMSNNPPNGPQRPFGGTNIQVKPNAPNTIQYLPARPPPPHSQGPSGMCSPSMGGPGPSGRSGPNLDFLQRYTNPSSGPVVNVNMGMNVNVSMGGNRMQYPPGPPPQGGMGNNGPMGGNGPMGSNGPMGGNGHMGGNGPPPGCGPMRGPPPPHQMIDQGQGQMGGPGQQMPHQMMGGPNGPGGMKGPPQGYPGAPNGPNGPGPGGPQPPPSDPAYAQQFHHFQQQLYATGTNNGRNPMQQNVQNNPNPPPNQSFFNY